MLLTRLAPELKQRILSGCALAAVGAVAVVLGGWINALWVALGSGIMVWELARMFAGGMVPFRGERAVLSLLTGGIGAVLAHGFGPGLALPAVALAAAALAFRATDAKPERLRLGGTAFAIGLAGALFVMLRDRSDAGPAIAIWLPLVVAFTDMGGYFVGRRFGGPKLAPRLSPKKTWSGALGGVVAATLASLLFALVAGGTPFTLGLVGGITAIVSQGGDLFESSLKRRLGVKDSGTILPGHGGAMDRFDGFVASTLFIGLSILVFPRLASLW